MRTQEEIAERIREVIPQDWLGTQVGDLVGFLEFNNAKEFLNPEATEEEWKVLPLADDSVKKTMAEYMNFAWEKCLGHRGVSAGRSLNHFQAWIWLLNDEKFLNELEETSYENYGAPKLRAICEHYGFSWPETEEEAKRMSVGEHCGADYDCGCGS